MSFMGRLLRWAALVLLLAAAGGGLYVGLLGGAGGKVTEKDAATVTAADKAVLASADALKAPAGVETNALMAATGPAAPAAPSRARTDGFTPAASLDLTLQALWPALATRAGAVRLDFAKTGRIVVVAEARGAANIQLLVALAGKFGVAGNAPFDPLSSDVELLPRDAGSGDLVPILAGTSGSALSETAFVVSAAGPVTILVADRSPGGADLRRPPVAVSVKVYWKAN
jgi:hypothetical protein